ncbi:hypothetical protein QOT17_014530 [Balamuthia mandrillaris]
MSRAVACLRCLCGYNCTLCYAIFSIWGVLMLLVCAVLLEEPIAYRKIDAGELKEDQLNKVALQLYIAAGMYAACVCGCGMRWGYLYLKHRRHSRFRTMGQEV